MNIKNFLKTVVSGVATAGLLLTVGCSTPQPGIKKIAAGQEHSGFLKDYGDLKPNPDLDAEALTFVNRDAQKNLRAYLAIMVDPIDTYVSTDVDASKVSESSRQAVANYFRHALVKAVSHSFPVVDEPGPLVLRLRAALVGIDVGGAVNASDLPEGAKALPHAINIGKVAVEMELVDSETGERIAARVDEAYLGQGADVGSERFSRVALLARM